MPLRTTYPAINRTVINSELIRHFLRHTWRRTPAFKLAWVMYKCTGVATTCFLAHYILYTVCRMYIIFMTHNFTAQSISIYCYVIHAASIVHSSSSLTSFQVLLAESSGSPRCAVPSLPSEALSADALFSIEGLLSRRKAKIMFWEFPKANWVGLKTMTKSVVLWSCWHPNVIKIWAITKWVVDLED